MERALRILAFVFVGIAFFFVWRQDLDAVFIAGVVGACCFFLAMRYEIERRRDARDAERRQREPDDQ